MTRFGVITDAHANLPALQTALAALEAVGCDFIVHTGDAIGIGPFPREVLDVLLGRPDIICLMGNHDELFAFDRLVNPPSWLGAGELEHQRWTQAQLPDEYRQHVAQWPYLYALRVGNTSFQFQHYAVNGGGYCPVSRGNVSSELDEAFQPESEIVFFGHHHPRADVKGKARYINPGALGTNPREGARFALIECEADSIQVTLHSQPYDAGPVRDAMRARGVPEADFLLNVFLNE